MQSVLVKWMSMLAMALSLSLTLTGCELGGGGGGGGGVGDIGDNNADYYVALGDSTTDGNNGGGDPFPPRVAAMTGKTVENLAEQDESAGEALAKVPGILSSRKPAVVMFLLGAVDVIGGHSTDETIASLRSIIELCQANQTVPVMATLQPMLYSHERFSAATKELNERIRDLASETGALLVDLEAAFGDGTAYILEDGLHPNEAGNQLMADEFVSVL